MAPGHVYGAKAEKHWLSHRWSIVLCINMFELVFMTVLLDSPFTFALSFITIIFTRL